MQWIRISDMGKMILIKLYWNQQTSYFVVQTDTDIDNKWQIQTARLTLWKILERPLPSRDQVVHQLF